MSQLLATCFGAEREPELFRALALLLTYASHSTLWAVGVTLLGQSKVFSTSTRNTLWKAALFAPLTTTLLASFLPALATNSLADGGYLPALSVAAPPSAAAVDATAGSATAAQDWQLLLGLWLCASAAGLLRFTGAALWLWQRLRGRRPVQDVRLIQRLEQLRTRVELPVVTLTESPAIGSPLVIGAAEICIPAGGLTVLDDAELDSVFAHELGHLERRDGFWFPAVGLLQAVLWLQPLNHWLAFRFRQSAELACDNRAVELTRDPLGLARALTRIAAATVFARQLSIVPTMARTQSTLLQRVKRLVQADPRDFETKPRGQGWGIACLVAIAVATPSLNVKVARAGSARAAVSSLDAQTATEQIAALLRREQQLERERAELRSGAAAELPSSQAAVRVLEVDQELSHIRATQRWIERQWQQRRDESDTAPR